MAKDFRGRATTALLALSAMVLTHCEPTTDDVLSMATAGAATTYDDALALHEEIHATGIQRPGTNQLVVPAQDETAYLECANGMMAMAVASSNKDMEELVSALDNTGPSATPVLHEANWVVVARDEAPLRQLQAELGGTIVPAS